ncbi:MAG: hypothetical protein GXP38_08990, partial [Chloroflexi bacterium]|nr:hypothetical protein [Chloroflexota bacterium]
MTPKQQKLWLFTVAGLLAGFLLGLGIGLQWSSLTAEAAISELAGDQKDDYVTLVAVSYAQDGNFERAQQRLAEIDAPNLAQLVAGVIERKAHGAGTNTDVSALAQLAHSLGVQENVIGAYLPTATPIPQPTNPPVPTPTPLPPTATPIPPTATMPPAPTETPTATPEPATATPTP